MATYKVTGPDGATYEVTAPDGASEQEVIDYAKNQFTKKPEESPFQSRVNQMPSFMRAVLGVGEAGMQAATGLGGTVLGGLAGLGDMARGGKDPAGTVRSVQDAITYQPRSTQGQKVGEVVAIPGQAYTSLVHKGGDLIRGDDSGGVRDFLGTTFDVAGESAPLVFGGASALKAARNAKPAPLTRQQQILANSQKEGYVVPPSEVGRASWLEGAGGKIRTAQTASARNVQVTNKLAARELGLPESTMLTDDLLGSIRKSEYKAGYEPLKNYKAPIVADDKFLRDVLDLSKTADRVRIDFPQLSAAGAKKVSDLADGVLVQQMTAEGAVEAIKMMRSEARRNLSWKAQPNADAIAHGQAQLAAANALESLIERNLTQAGQAQLLDAFRAARVRIAKTHTVENALNDATGNVSARALAAGKDSGALTGGLKTAADFGRAFTKANQMPEIFGGTPPISPLDVSMGALMATGGQLASGNIGGAALGGIPLLRPFAAPAALRPSVQRGLLTNPRPMPNFGVIPPATMLFNPYNLQDQEQ